MKIVHIILNLGYGGAENMLIKLVNHDEVNKIMIITLTDFCPLKLKLRNNNALVINSFPRGESKIVSFIKLFRLIKEFKPDIIQSWMYHSELIGLLIKICYPKSRLFWNIRCSTSEWMKLRPRNKFIFSLLKLGFGSVTGIVVNSKTEYLASIKLGYPEDKLIYIPNGFEYTLGIDKKESRTNILNKFNLNASSVLIGMVARNDVSKDHDTIIEAFKIVLSGKIAAHLILVGAGFDDHFAKKLFDNGVSENIHIYGTADHIFDVIIGFDIATLSSRTESFPNVIAEYMLASLPVVATRVADIPEIIGDTGIVVDPGDYIALADGINSIINMSEEKRTMMGKQAHQKIMDEFHIDKIYNTYIENYHDHLS